MIEVSLALIGYGNVAQGLTQILLEKGAEYEKRYGITFLITAITDPLKGTAFNPDGLPLQALIDTVQATGSIDTVPGTHPGWDAMEMIQNSPADVVVEMSYTNLQTGEPATTYIAEALRRKKNVVTTNKGPIALYYDTLSATARLHGVNLGVEGTVMSGTPTLRIGHCLLGAAGVHKIQGILNGTTNYILTQMENGQTYEAALAEAQRQGYAEADPTSDVEGFDAAAKVAILARIVLDTPLTFASVEREGITKITARDISEACAVGKHWKLVGTVEKLNGKVTASVRPECLSNDHPLANITGITNAVVYSTNFLGDVTLTGPGAGRLQTGYAIIQDLLFIYGVLMES